MHRRQTFRALAMASVLLALPSFAQETDDTEAVPVLKGALPAKPVDPIADPMLSETEEGAAAGSGVSQSESVAVTGSVLRGSLPSSELRAVVRPVPPNQSAKLPAVAPSLPVVAREADARAEYEPLGLRFGSFVVNATATTGIGLRHHSIQGDETFMRSTGVLAARSDWERNSVDLSVGGAFRRSLSGIEEKLPEGDARLAGRFDITDADRLTAVAGWTLRDEASGDGKENIFSGSLGYERFGGLIGLKTGLGIDRTVNETDPTLDNTTLSLSLRLSHDSGAVLQPFVEVGAFGRDFDKPAAGDGINRSGVGGEAKVGVAVVNDDLTGEIALGYGYEWLRADGLDDMSGLIGSASLSWDASELLRLTTTATTSFEPTSTAGASGVVKRIGEATVTYALAPNAFVVAGGELTLEDYVGIDRNVTTTALKAGVGYKLNRSVELGLDGEHKIVRSSEAGGDYTDSSVTATLTLRQ
ncbi:outer membrane beta-barrel protein [Pleomorphomonas sp. NRK KF1]|uniref:outer membrane beta-barrel protein n=1 Tax=Pleomorphomonas sp. NRK KF1 TaxID=2943000 RepID=UPI002042C063|nr:outer membrane beta-barrel protein [Pleomorphomonas sp. NRK KF1]